MTKRTRGTHVLFIWPIASRLNSVVKCPTSGPLFLRKPDVIWAEISISIVFPDVTNRIVMSATLNIGSPMITEGYGSFFSIWRQTHAVVMRDAARNIKSRRRIKFPTPLVLWSNAAPQVRCSPSNSPLPGQGRGSNARGMPGLGHVRISNWSVHKLHFCIGFGNNNITMRPLHSAEICPVRDGDLPSFSSNYAISSHYIRPVLQKCTYLQYFVTFSTSVLFHSHYMISMHPPIPVFHRWYPTLALMKGNSYPFYLTTFHHPYQLPVDIPYWCSPCI